MADSGVCVVALVLVVVIAVQGSKVRRSDVTEYLFDTVEDASIAGDYVGVGPDCSDDDSSESIELAYIINKREVPSDQRTQVAQNTAAMEPAARSLQTNARSIV